MTSALSILAATTLLLVTPSIASAQQEEVERGRDVFEADCAMCHGQDASGMMGMHPSLRGAVERLSFEGVEVTIRNGRDTSPPMPAFEGRLNDQEIADVIAYLDTLPVGPRNFGPDNDGMMGGGMDGMMGGGGMWSWFAWSVVFLIALAAIVIASIFVARRLDRSRPPAGALDILKERYARGEIDRNEFEERRRMLSD